MIQLYQTINFTNGEKLAVVNGMGGQEYHTRYVYGTAAFQIWHNGTLKQYISNGAISKDTVWEVTRTSSEGRYRALNTVINRYVFDRITPSPNGVLFLCFSYSMGEGAPVIVNTDSISIRRPFRGYPPVTLDRNLFEESIAQERDQPVLFFDPIDGHAEWWTGNSPGNMSWLGDRFDTSQTDFTWIPSDPYTPGGESGTGGGTGDFDGTSTPIDFPDLPAISAVDTGFVTLFNPTAPQLKNLANYMWGTQFDLNSWKELFGNAMECILGLSIVPVAVPSGGQDTVKIGNIDSGIYLDKANGQYVSVDCGSLNVNEYWGAYLDYSPYTKINLYLPYVGTVALETDDVMGKTIHIKYHIDLLSGSCVAYVKCGDSVLYSYNGQVSISIPCTGRDFTNVINSVMRMGAVGLGIGALTGGLAAPLVAGAAMAGAATNVIKPNVQKSGNISSMSGLLGIQTPYLQLTRPRQCLPSRQNEYIGYPSYMTITLSDATGFTRCEIQHLETSATETEKIEIENMLRNGVIF